MSPEFPYQTTAVAEKLRLLLVDDHESFLLSIQLLLESEFTVLGTVSDAEKLLDEVRRLNPQIVIVDFAMPKLNGIEATRLLMEEVAIPVIILTSYSDPGLVRQAFATGARGFVLKSRAAEDLPVAIQRVSAGESFVSEPLIMA